MPTLAPFANEPVLELRRAPVRAQLQEALGRLTRSLPLHVPVMIGAGERVGEELHSTDPGEPDNIVAVAACATPSEVADAVAEADRGFRAWRAVSAEDRAAALIRAAAWLRERRLEIAALEVRECAKPWPEADADVCEAIDFLEYYARGAIELDRGPHLLQVPGERNEMRYGPRGVVAVVAPWNFPVAIPCGMTAAALATGNAVVLKPAEQSPGCALMLVQALRAGGVPSSAISLLPGEGDAGAALVAHPGVHTIAFTGSMPVGVEITARRGGCRARPAPSEAGGVGARRQELRDRRLRRGSRRGGTRHRVLGVRVRRPEVLGGVHEREDTIPGSPRPDPRRSRRSRSSSPRAPTPPLADGLSGCDLPPRRAATRHPPASIR